MQLDLSGKRALVTGSTGGIGYAIAKALGELGANVAINGRTQDRVRDAVERLGLHSMLLEPELLAAVEPDVHLVSTLLSLRGVLPEQTKETARAVVRTVVAELERPRSRTHWHNGIRICEAFV